MAVDLLKVLKEVAGDAPKKEAPAKSKSNSVLPKAPAIVKAPKIDPLAEQKRLQDQKSAAWGDKYGIKPSSNLAYDPADNSFKNPDYYPEVRKFVPPGTEHMKKEEVDKLYKKMGVRPLDELLADNSLNLEQKSQLMKSYGSALSGAHQSNLQSKMFGKEWPDQEELHEIMGDIKNSPTPGMGLQRFANQALLDQILEFQKTPRNWFNAKMFAEGLKHSGATGSTEGLSEGESEQERMKALMGMYDKLSGNAAQSAQMDIGQINALRTQPDALTRSMMDRVGTQRPVSPGVVSSTDKATIGLGKAYETAQLPALSQSLESLDKLIPGGLLGWSGQPIPGFTPVDKGFSLIKANTLLDPNAQRLVQAVQALHNSLILARSGKTVTAQESDRLIKELGSGTFSTQLQLMSAIREAHNLLEAKARNFRGTFGQKAEDAYTKGAGKGILPDLQKPGAVAPQAAPPTLPPNASLKDQADALSKKLGGKK